MYIMYVIHIHVYSNKYTYTTSCYVKSRKIQWHQYITSQYITCTYILHPFLHMLHYTTLHHTSLHFIGNFNPPPSEKKRRGLWTTTWSSLVDPSCWVHHGTALSKWIGYMGSGQIKMPMDQQICGFYLQSIFWGLLNFDP